jgi:hypothetical protein
MPGRSARPRKKSGLPKGYKFPGKQPTPAQLAQKTGPRFEDGSFRVKGGGGFDPDTGRIKRPKKRK